MCVCRTIASSPGDSTVRPLGSGPPSGDPKAVAVRVHEVAFASGEPVFIDGNPKLGRHCIYVLDVEMKQGAGAGIAPVLRKVNPDAAPSHTQKPRETRLEPVLHSLTNPSRPYHSTARARCLERDRKWSSWPHFLSTLTFSLSRWPGSRARSRARPGAARSRSS